MAWNLTIWLRKQFREEKRTTVLLCLFVLIYLVFAIPLLYKIPFNDEAVWVRMSESPSFNNNGIPHPPLGLYIYRIAYHINHNLRIVPFLFNLVSLIVLFYFVKGYYSRKIAFITLFLATFNFWFLFASTQIDMNGCILSFLFLLGTIILLTVDNKMYVRKIVLLTLVATLMIYTKYTEYALFLLFFLVWLVFEENLELRKKALYFFVPAVLSVLLFALFPLIAYVSGNYDFFLSSIGHSGSAWGLSIRPILAIFMYGFIFLVFALLFLLKVGKIGYKEKPFLIWTLVGFFFYCIAVGSRALAYERYLMIIVLPMVILGAKLLNDLSYADNKHSFFQIIGWSFLFMLVNLRQVSYLPHNPGRYLSNFLHLNFSFNLPYIGSSGPMFYINAESLLLLVLLSLFLIFLYILIKRRILLHTLISLNIAFSLFLIVDYGFSLTHHDYNKVSNDLLEYYKLNGFKEPIYYNPYQRGIALRLGANQIIDTSQQIMVLDESISKNHGTAILIDFPLIDKSGETIRLIEEKCKLEKSFTDKGASVAWIYRC